MLLIRTTCFVGSLVAAYAGVNAFVYDDSPLKDKFIVAVFCFPTAFVLGVFGWSGPFRDRSERSS